MKKRSLIKVSISELRALTLLARNDGLFGSELVHRSGGFLGRGTIYTTLNRLIEKGCVESVCVEASVEYNLERPRYKISKRGLKVIEDFAKEFGFHWNQ